MHYSFSVEEEWRRVVISYETDKEGRQREVRRVETGWTTVDSETESVPFYLKDDVGHILVHPKGAEIQPTQVFSAQVSSFDPLYYGKGPNTTIADSTGVRRFQESAIPLQASIFVAGQSRERQDIVAPEIAHKEGEEYFLISTKNRDAVASGLGWSIWLSFFGALFLLLLANGIALISILQQNFTDFSPLNWIAPVFTGGEVLLIILAWFAFATLTIYNSLIILRNRVEQGWKQVDIQLKRRHDLIPNLIATVKAIRDHEIETHQSVASMRSQLSATPPGQPGDDFRSVVPQLVALREAYPNLKSDQNFLALQNQIEQTENRIALARTYFNDIATFFNTRLEVIPDRFLASLAGLRSKSLLAADDFERATVTVNFAPATSSVPAKN